MNFSTYEQTNEGITSTGTVTADSFDAAMAIARERRTNASMSYGVVPEGRPLPDPELRNAMCNPCVSNDFRKVGAIMRKRGINLRKKRFQMMHSPESVRRALKRRVEIGKGEGGRG
jgi:hypothetical protein